MKIVYLAPKSSFRNPLRSDSLFGLLCWGIEEIFGVEKLETILLEFKKGKPPFLISSAFPYKLFQGEKILYFPKPTLKPINVEATPEKMGLYKEYKKTRWVPEDIFLSLRAGKLSLQEFFDQKIWEEIKKPIQDAIPVMHNNIERISGASTKLFYTEEFFIENGGLFFLLDIYDQQIEPLFEGVFQFYSHVGFGGDASIGKGHFHLEMYDYQKFQDLEKAVSLLNLSLYFPSEAELEHIKNRPELTWYKLETRKGKSGGRFYTSPNVWKKSVTVFKEGSSFPKIDNQKVYGAFPVVQHFAFPVYYYGYGMMIDFIEKGAQ